MYCLLEGKPTIMGAVFFADGKPLIKTFQPIILYGPEQLPNPPRQLGLYLCAESWKDVKHAQNVEGKVGISVPLRRKVCGPTC